MLNDFTLILLSLLLETLPFVILASLISGFMEHFIPSSVISKIATKNPLLSVLMGSSVGFFIPMCECGSVLIAKRLIKKGMLPAGAIAYMLSGPIVSPVTLFSTYTAYYYYPQMTLYRMFMGMAVASLVSLLVQKLTKGDVLKERKNPFELNVVHSTPLTLTQKVRHSLNHAVDDFMSVYPLLLLGISLTALFKVLVPVDVMLVVREESYVGVLLAPLLAVSLSLCAEADAFIASALNNVLSTSAQLVFLVVGPMLDVKLFLLYTQVFNRKALKLIVLLPTTLTLTLTLLWELLA